MTTQAPISWVKYRTGPYMTDPQRVLTYTCPNRRTTRVKITICCPFTAHPRCRFARTDAMDGRGSCRQRAQLRASWTRPGVRHQAPPSPGALRARNAAHPPQTSSRRPTRLRATPDAPARLVLGDSSAKVRRRLPLYTCSGHASGRTSQRALCSAGTWAICARRPREFDGSALTFKGMPARSSPLLPPCAKTC